MPAPEAPLFKLYKRMKGALKLDALTFEEVGADPAATAQAVIVVVLGALAHVIGTGTGGLNFMLAFAVRLLAWWVILASLIYILGKTLFRTPETNASWWKLLRTVGFAMTPRGLRIFSFIPWVGAIIFYLVTVWQFAAMVVAVRQAFGYQSTSRAALVVGASLVPLVLLEPFLLGQV